MDIDGLGGSTPTLTSLVVQSLAIFAKRHGGHSPKGPRRNPIRRSVGKPKRNRPQLGDMTPTKAWTQPIKVESLEVYEGGPGRGHTIARHVNHAPNADVERLRREPDVPASGSFTDLPTAQRALEAAVAANVDGIRNWLGQGNAKGPFVRDFDMGASIGSVLTRREYKAALARGDTPAPSPVSGIRIVLRKSGDFPGGFFVLTAYPVPRTSAAEAPELSVEPLTRYEGPGHTIARHVNVTAADMVNRLDAESEITAASRFVDLETAQRAVERGILEKAGEIHDWLESGNRFPFSGDVSFSDVIGVVLTRSAYERGRRQPAAANRLHFTLVKSPDYPSGFYVKTAYPVLPW